MTLDYRAQLLLWLLRSYESPGGNMTGNEMPFDPGAAVTASFGLVAAGRADLVTWLDTYLTIGYQLTETARDQLRQLKEPAVSPARTDAIEGLTRELEEFVGLWTPVVSNAGLLLF